MFARVAPLPTEAGPFATALRRFRAARRMSQLDLALGCDVSARHLSFLESGRAQPSRDMVLRLAAGLLAPLGAQNALLQAAGFAPMFPASPLASEALAPLRAILTEMMARHAPNPALLVNRHWTVLDANPTARALLAPLNERAGGGDARDAAAGEMNVVRMLTESPRAALAIGNLAEVLEELSARLRLEALEAGDDPVLAGLVASLDAARAGYPAALATTPRRPLIPLVLNTPGQPLRFLSTIVHFGTSEDVTVRDLRLELLFPADDHTRATMAVSAI